MKDRILVFSDLDGTLLDHRTYSYDAARPAIDLLREKKIPLILCTSKTRAEIEDLRTVLGNTEPFIAENGGAIFIPAGYFPGEIPGTEKGSEYWVIELGTPYVRLLEFFSRVKALFPGKLRGFSDLTAREVAELTGLSLREAELAAKREYDEVFLAEDAAVVETVKVMAASSGLKITQGGRYFHLTGDNDKGEAVRRLQAIYDGGKSGVRCSIGLGDSLNDLPMLQAVDFPVLVQKPGGQYDPAIRMDNLIFAPGIGPEGWRAAVIDLISRLAG
jgi:mannosyl-3-phosphoglycerate phosphatase